MSLVGIDTFPFCAYCFDVRSCNLSGPTLKELRILASWNWIYFAHHDQSRSLYAFPQYKGAAWGQRWKLI